MKDIYWLALAKEFKATVGFYPGLSGGGLAVSHLICHEASSLRGSGMVPANQRHTLHDSVSSQTLYTRQGPPFHRSTDDNQKPGLQSPQQMASRIPTDNIHACPCPPTVIGQKLLHDHLSPT